MKTIEIKSQTSICENCTNKGACVFEKNAGSPIYSCDTYEFSTGEIDSKKSKIKKLRNTTSLYKLGVCSNCINTKTCCIRTKGEVKFYCELHN